MGARCFVFDGYHLGFIDVGYFRMVQFLKLDHSLAGVVDAPTEDLLPDL